jgi:hypothetical protein
VAEIIRKRIPWSPINGQPQHRRQNHRRASTSRPDIAKLARMAMKIRSFMNSAG